jgi:hypothetical protein
VAKVTRLTEAVLQRLHANPQAVRQRRETVEHPFGTMKARVGATHFLTNDRSDPDHWMASGKNLGDFRPCGPGAEQYYAARPEPHPQGAPARGRRAEISSDQADKHGR